MSEKWGEVLLATEKAVRWGEETSAEHANGVGFETLGRGWSCWMGVWGEWLWNLRYGGFELVVIVMGYM